MKNYIYIIGAGRSGTTLVDILLGNSKSTFSLGEINRFAKKKGIVPGRSEEDDVKRFWNSIKNEVEKEYNLDEVYRYSKSFEYHSAFFRKIFSVVKKKEKEKYFKYLRSFNEILNSNVTEPIGIDSSKYPMRALYLSEAIGPFTGCLQIIKHPVSVLRSFLKKDIEQPSKHWMVVNLYLIAINVISFYVKRRLKKRRIPVLTYRYEDIVKDPVRFLKKIEACFQIDLSDLCEKITKNEALKVGFLFDGNRIRLQKEINLIKHSKTDRYRITEWIVYFCNLFWWRQRIDNRINKKICLPQILKEDRSQREM